MSRVIIIAGGSGKRWAEHLSKPKHLIPVLDEPIIHRTCRLLHELTPIRDVLISSTNPDYLAYDAQLAEPRGYENTRGGAKKFLDNRYLWNEEGRTIVLYGDVFFTEDAIRTITEYDKDEWQLFCRFGGSGLTGTPWGECFAQSFLPKHHQQHFTNLLYVSALYAEGRIARCGGWEHYRAMNGKDGEDVLALTTPAANLGKATEINDWTDDFDWPADYQRFIERYWKAHTRCPS